MPFETLNDDRKPVLMIVVGRQRVGKTTFLNALAQYLRAMTRPSKSGTRTR
jgi:GTPase Era involved in 16S rRNA processing